MISLRTFVILLLVFGLGAFALWFIKSDKNILDVLNHRDALEFKIRHKNEELSLTSDQEKDYQQLIKQWSGNLNSIGSMDINSYAPDISLRSKQLTVNLQRNRTIIGWTDYDGGMWNQYSRRPVASDVKLRTFLDEIIQEKLKYE